jgi:co-chaperonin GroES (HSP10)
MSKLAGLVPMYNRLLVRRAINPGTTPKGIIVNTSDKKQGTYVAKVLAIGSQAFKEVKDGKTETWFDMKVDNEVLLSEYAGTRVEELSDKDGETLLIKDTEILAVLKKA